MCSAFTLDCSYGIAAIILFGDLYCPNTKCSGKLCFQEKTFESLGRSDYQCRHCASVFQVCNILYEDQTSSFFLSFGQGAFFVESSKSIQEVNGDVYCPGKFCLTERNANL